MTSSSGDWKTFGAVRVLALRDAVVDYPWPLAELFPGVPDEAWTPFRERFPAAFGGAQVWRSSYRCYLMRSEGRTVLVDTGMGAAGSPLSATLGLAGELMEALEAAGTRPDDIDVVVLTHLHPDHVGGNLSGDPLAFPRARYVVPRADWQHFHLPEVQAHFPFAFVEQTITPLERLRALARHPRAPARLGADARRARAGRRAGGDADAWAHAGPHQPADRFRRRAGAADRRRAVAS